MKIDDRNLTGASAAETGRVQESEKLSRAGKSSIRGKDGSSDHVEFSGTLNRLSRTLTTFEAAHASRVQALAGQYQSGNYRPDSLATSKGLVAEALSAGLQ